jgi:hypothetical protein
MYSVTVLERKTGRTFAKHFGSPYLAKAFMKKLNYSKELLVVSTEGFW